MADTLNLRPFQRQFLAAALKPGIRTACLSTPRGNGKSTLAAWLAFRLLTPDDPLFVKGSESYLCASSIGQARRSTFKLLREFVDDSDDDYRVAESALTCHVVHRPSNTRLSVLASSGKTAQGLVRAPWVIADEPGSWEVAGGQLLHEAIQTAMGKPGSPLRALYIGTIAPSDGSGWWGRMLAAGSRGSRHVTLIQAHRDDLRTKWDSWPVIRKSNPLMACFADSRAALLEERNDARADSRLKAAFLSYRLNVPTADEATALLTLDDWHAMCARPVGEPEGRPVVGLDLGAGRAWSAACAVWPATGRVEAVAVAPGIPALEKQEQRDSVPKGTYQELHDAGVLHVADGLRIPPVKQLMALVAPWMPRAVLADRHNFDALRDAKVKNLILRIPRWKESTSDIRGLRALALDGNLNVDAASRRLLFVSLTAGRVVNDDSGGTRFSMRSIMLVVLVMATGRPNSFPAASTVSMACATASRLPPCVFSMSPPVSEPANSTAPMFRSLSWRAISRTLATPSGLSMRIQGSRLPFGGSSRQTSARSM